jgi:23S rRNA A2030 N6-methylase RlmJ
MAERQQIIRSYDEYKKHIRNTKRQNHVEKRLKAFLDLVEQYNKEARINRLPKRTPDGRFVKS